MPTVAKRHLECARADADTDDDDDGNGGLPAKRCRFASSIATEASTYGLVVLSDELMIRIFSYMDENTLLVVAPVSKRFHRIACDSQLWRFHYYRRFVLPRVHRISGSRASRMVGVPSTSNDSARSRCRGPVISGASMPDLAVQVDWKKQYRLRHNWARGQCAVDQVPVRGAERSSTPEGQTLVRVVDGLAVTADGEAGLRAWDLKTRKLVAQTHLTTSGLVQVQPTCLAVDEQRLSAGLLDMAVGFLDGTFGIWRLNLGQWRLRLVFRQDKSYLGQLVAVAYNHPYVLMATNLGYMTLYSFDHSDDADAASHGKTQAMRDQGMGGTHLSAPSQLTSLKSHSSRFPLALSIRRVGVSAVASIAYTFDAMEGWAIGIQDLDIRHPSGRPKPDVVSSRVAYTLPTKTRRSALAISSSATVAGSASSQVNEEGPVRLCYSHPYLLATLNDNCMMLHLCTSTATSLSISPGIRLWGHTSGISDAEITPRGKAVSVSTRGDEIRLWELEGRVGGSSVEIRPRPQRGSPGGEGSQAHNTDAADWDDLTDRKNWVGFDSEMVVVLKEAKDGRESLVVYDFT